MKIIPKGILKAFILKELSKKPMHGYELIKRIEKITRFWRPSPGTIYPLLKSMVGENLLRFEVVNRRKVYFLTKKGKRKLKKIEYTRSQIKEEMIEKFSKILNIKKDELEKFLRIGRDERIEELKSKIFELLEYCILACKKGKGDKAKDILEHCLADLKNI